MYPPKGIIELDGKRYEWRYHGCICGPYEVEEPQTREAATEMQTPNVDSL
jgi:hypothetical protein